MMNTKPLSYLPNLVGYAFKGITHSGDVLLCTVSKDANGMHYIQDSNGNRCYKGLKGWTQT